MAELSSKMYAFSLQKLFARYSGLGEMLQNVSRAGRVPVFCVGYVNVDINFCLIFLNCISNSRFFLALCSNVIPGGAQWAICGVVSSPSVECM